MDTATLDMQAPASGQTRAWRSADLVISAGLCVVLPILFWLGVAAFGMWLATGSAPSVLIQVLLSGAMALVLVPVWASLFVVKPREGAIAAD